MANPAHAVRASVVTKFAARPAVAVWADVTEEFQSLLACERVRPMHAFEVEGVELQTKASSFVPDLTACEHELVGADAPPFGPAALARMYW
jgi:hypothetical protein